MCGRVDSKLLRKEPGRELCPFAGGEEGIGPGAELGAGSAVGLYGSCEVEVACVCAGANCFVGGGSCTDEPVGLYGS